MFGAVMFTLRSFCPINGYRERL